MSAVRRFHVSLIAAALLASFLAGCGSGGGGSTGGIGFSAAAEDASADHLLTSTTATVRAAIGGTLVLPNGAKLIIPPGALPYDTTLRFSTPTDPADDRVRYYEVEPSMVLAKPATLVLPFNDDNPAVNDDLLSVLTSSETLPTLESSGERTNWSDEANEVVSIDCERRLVTLEVTHFSVNIVWNRVDDPAYLVVSLPSQYMKPGDILTCLTGAQVGIGPKGHYNWFTGHSGLFCGTGRPELAGLTVTDSHGVLVDPTPDIVESVGKGVSPGSVASFRPGFENDHIDLGPRRALPELAVTDADREAVVSFALRQLGKGYNLLGDGGTDLRGLLESFGLGRIPGLDASGYSCSGLVDAAYLSIDKPVATPADRRTVAVTPRDVFLQTVPVTEMMARVGDVVRVPVYGVVVDPASAGVQFPGGGSTLKGWYTDQRSKTHAGVTSSYTITASDLPPGATFTPQGNGVGYLLSWTPTSDGSTTITFTMNPDAKAGFRLPFGNNLPVSVKNGTRPLQQSLTISVTP